MTDDNERCQLTELPKSSCDHCRPKAKQAEWKARHESVCRHPQCLGVIDIGEPVTWNPEGTGVIHARHAA